MSKRQLLDRVGTCASAICAVHCILSGVALGLLSALGLGFFGSIWIDAFFVAIAVVVGAVALWHGAKRHGSYLPALFYVAGLVFIIVAHFEDFSHGFPVHAEHRHGLMTTAASVLGGLCFVMFHVLNMRLQHSHACTCASEIPASQTKAKP